MRIVHATTNYRMLAPYLEAADKNDGYVKFVADGYMDLTIEQLWYEDPFGNPVYSMAHWGELNGDAMKDPEVTFGVNKEKGEIIPLSYENSYCAYYREVFNGDKYNPSELKGIDDFLNMWLKNIQEQGFAPDKIKEFI